MMTRPVVVRAPPLRHLGHSGRRITLEPVVPRAVVKHVRNQAPVCVCSCDGGDGPDTEHEHAVVLRNTAEHHWVGLEFPWTQFWAKVTPPKECPNAKKKL